MNASDRATPAQTTHLAAGQEERAPTRQDRDPPCPMLYATRRTLDFIKEVVELEIRLASGPFYNSSTVKSLFALTTPLLLINLQIWDNTNVCMTRVLYSRIDPKE